MRTVALAPLGLMALGVAACAGPEIERGVPDDGRAHDIAFAITALTVPGEIEGAAIGADLDGRDADPSRGTVATCEDLSLDRVSVRSPSERGVDDAAIALLPVVRDVLGEPLDEAIARAIARGELAIGIAIRGVRARGDGSVEVAIFSLAEGRELAVGAGTIEGTTVRARFDAIAIPVAPAIPFLPLGELGESELVLDLALDAQGNRVLHGAQLGTSVPVASIVRDVDALDPRWSSIARDMLEATADLVPSAADPMICERLSVGLAIEGEAHEP